MTIKDYKKAEDDFNDILSKRNKFDSLVIAANKYMKNGEKY